MMRVHRITDTELDMLATGASQRLESIGLLTFFSGMFFSFLIAVLTIPENVPSHLVVGFFIMCVVRPTLCSLSNQSLRRMATDRTIYCAN